MRSEHFLPLLKDDGFHFLVPSKDGGRVSIWAPNPPAPRMKNLGRGLTPQIKDTFGVVRKVVPAEEKTSTQKTAAIVDTVSPSPPMLVPASSQSKKRRNSDSDSHLPASKRRRSSSAATATPDEDSQASDPRGINMFSEQFRPCRDAKRRLPARFLTFVPKSSPLASARINNYDSAPPTSNSLSPKDSPRDSFQEIEINNCRELPTIGVQSRMLEEEGCSDSEAGVVAAEACQPMRAENPHMSYLREGTTSPLSSKSEGKTRAHDTDVVTEDDFHPLPTRRRKVPPAVRYASLRYAINFDTATTSSTFSSLSTSPSTSSSSVPSSSPSLSSSSSASFLSRPVSSDYSTRNKFWQELLSPISKVYQGAAPACRQRQPSLSGNV